MRRFQAFSFYFLLLVGLIVNVGRALADPPDVTTSYKFLPRLSTLREMGGFAGVDWQFPVFGTYDLVTGFRYVPRIPADAMLTPYAEFTNVDAYGAYPTMDLGLSLDVVFNLSELDSELIYKGPLGLELYRFEGTAGFNEPYSRVELLAARLGRWTYLRGSTEAPCCDFFEYELKGLARQMPSADWDEDGIVDAADLARWHDDYAAGMSGRDFLEWQRQHGDVAPSLAVFDSLMNEALAAISASLVSVPEPTGVCLLAAGIGCSCLGRRNWL